MSQSLITSYYFAQLLLYFFTHGLITNDSKHVIGVKQEDNIKKLKHLVHEYLCGTLIILPSLYKGDSFRSIVRLK